MTSLARFGLPAGVATSISVTEAHKVSENEALILYTFDSVDYADIFEVSRSEDMELLVAGAGDGEHLNAIIQPGTGDSTSQPVVVSVQTIVE